MEVKVNSLDKALHLPQNIPLKSKSHRSGNLNKALSTIQHFKDNLVPDRYVIYHNEIKTCQCDHKSMQYVLWCLYNTSDTSRAWHKHILCAADNTEPISSSPLISICQRVWGTAACYEYVKHTRMFKMSVEFPSYWYVHSLWSVTLVGVGAIWWPVLAGRWLRTRPWPPLPLPHPAQLFYAFYQGNGLGQFTD